MRFSYIYSTLLFYKLLLTVFEKVVIFYENIVFVNYFRFDGSYFGKFVTFYSSNFTQFLVHVPIEFKYI